MNKLQEILRKTGHTLGITKKTTSKRLPNITEKAMVSKKKTYAYNNIDNNILEGGTNNNPATMVISFHTETGKDINVFNNNQLYHFFEEGERVNLTLKQFQEIVKDYVNNQFDVKQVVKTKKPTYETYFVSPLGKDYFETPSDEAFFKPLERLLGLSAEHTKKFIEQETLTGRIKQKPEKHAPYKKTSKNEQKAKSNEYIITDNYNKVYIIPKDELQLMMYLSPFDKVTVVIERFKHIKKDYLGNYFKKKRIVSITEESHVYLKKAE